VAVEVAHHPRLALRSMIVRSVPTMERWPGKMRHFESP
jgi:hypothetical protein